MSTFNFRRDYINCFNNLYPFGIQGEIIIEGKLRGTYSIDLFKETLSMYTYLGCEWISLRVDDDITPEISSFISDIKRLYEFKVILDISTIQSIQIESVLPLVDLIRYRCSSESLSNLSIISFLDSVKKSYIELEGGTVSSSCFLVLEDTDIPVYQVRKLIS